MSKIVTNPVNLIDAAMKQKGLRLHTSHTIELDTGGESMKMQPSLNNVHPAVFIERLNKLAAKHGMTKFRQGREWIYGDVTGKLVGGKSYAYEGPHSASIALNGITLWSKTGEGSFSALIKLLREVNAKQRRAAKRAKTKK